jgi:hypothetical protein
MKPSNEEEIHILLLEIWEEILKPQDLELNPTSIRYGTEISEASSCKYLGIILRSDLRWVDHVNYTVKKNLEGTLFYNASCKKMEIVTQEV